MNVLRCLSVLLAFFPLHLAAQIEFLQVEGMMLGYYPSLGDGVFVDQRKGSTELTFSPRHRCLQVREAQLTGIPFDERYYEPEDPRTVRNKLTGLIGYPGISNKELEEEWLRSANGLAAKFYVDNLAKKPDDSVIQLVFMPAVLAPKPVQVTKTEWTPEARRILDTEGSAGLERYCGSHFIEAVGEENYVIYSIRISLPTPEERARLQNVRLERPHQTPGVVLNNLFRMNQRFEFTGLDRSAVTDVLVVGGRPSEMVALTQALRQMDGEVQIEKAKDSYVARARITCPPSRMEPCQRLAQTVLDYQFGRLKSGGPQSYVPVRFRIAPMSYLKVMNE